MKLFMRTIEFVTALVFALSITACDRLSEKDKMEMVTMCDTIARRHFKEEEKTYEASMYVRKSVKLETHYSFEDSKCYALETSNLLMLSGDKPIKITALVRSKTLYDGMTKEKVLAVNDSTIENKIVKRVSGSLASEDMSQEEASKAIRVKMGKP